MTRHFQQLHGVSYSSYILAFGMLTLIKKNSHFTDFLESTTLHLGYSGPLTICASLTFLPSCQFRQPSTSDDTPIFDLSSSFPNPSSSTYLPQIMKLRSGVHVAQVPNGGIAQSPKTFQAM